MRTFALLLSLLFAACHLKADKVPAFENGKRYTYDYRGRVATGVSDDVHHLSGYGLTSQLIIQNTNDEVVFMFKDTKLGTMNDKLEHLMDEMPLTYKTPAREAAKAVSEMEKPWWVNYDNGLVRSMFFAKDDHTPEYNVKKAITSLFQTDFRREGIDDLHVYSVMEDGIGGLCETIYSVGHNYDHDMHMTSHDDHKIMNVTKIRHYDQCESRPHLVHSSFIGEPCRDCKQKSFQPLRSTGQVIYEIKGTREHFTIETIHSYGGNVLTPFTPNGNTVYSVVNQTLHLVKVEDATPINKPGSTEEITSLAYTFPHHHRDVDSHDLKEAHYFNKVYDREFPERMAEAEKYWNELKAVVKEYGKESKYVWKFVQVFQKFSYDDFVQFFNKNVHGDDKGMKSFIYEVLPLVGTNPSIVYAMELIQTGKVGQSDAYEMIRKVPFYVKQPTMKLLTAVKDFGMTKVVTDDHKLFSTSRLAYGTLIFRGCVEHLHNARPEEAKTYIPKDQCTAMIEYLIKRFQEITDPIEKSIYLRAISNTRSEEAFTFLLKIVKDDKYEITLRQSAIWALYPYIDETHSGKIAGAMTFILDNIDEDYVLRIYAFEVLMYSHPDADFFAKLIVLMSKEHNEKLKSYIYSTLSSYANSTDPCDEEYTLHAQQTLQFLEHYERDIVKDSVNRIFSVYNEKFNYGRTTQFAMIPNNYSIFPRELYMRQSINLLGTNFDFLEIGYNTEGRSMIDALWHRNMGPRALHKHDLALTNPSLKEVVDRLHLKDAIQEDFKPYEVYIKMFNQDIYVSRDLISDLIARSKSSEITYEDGKLNMNLHSIGYINGEYIIPNELGLPVSMMIDIPLAYHIGGNARYNPKSEEMRGFHADFNMRLAMDFTVYSHMVVKGSVFEHYGYALKTKGGVKMPLKGSVDIDLITKKTAFKYIPSTEPYDVVYYKSVPYTVGETWIPVTYDHESTNKQYPVGHDYFGVGVTHNFTYDYFWNDYGSYRSFLKSFFKKSSSFEDYFYLSDKWYAGTRNFIDYALLNPTAKPFYYNMHFEPSTNSPTTEFLFTSERSYNKNYESNDGQAVFKYSAALVGKGQDERKWNADLHVSTSWPERDSRKVAFTFKRSPLPKYDSKPYEVCYQGDVLYTDWAKAYTSFPADLKVQWNGRLNVGESCKASDARSIIINAVAQKSEEQLSIEKSTLPYYKKCQDLTKKGHELNEYCWKVMKDNGRIDKVTVDIEHKNLPDKVKGVFYRLYSWFRHTFYNNLEFDPFHGHGQENHIKIVANVSYEHPVLDVQVERPDKTIYYHNIYIPSILPRWTPFTVVVPKWERWASRVFNYHVPKCFISSKYIRTFDDVFYKAPLGDCWYLAFADASDHHMHVLYRAEGDKKAMKVLFDNDEIEIIPRGDQFTVTVNGEPKMTDKPVYMHKEKDEIRFVVYKYAGKYVVASKFYGVHVTHDGAKSMIKTTNFYRGKQLGLCGNFDGEKEDEFQGPTGRVYKDATEFTRSYGVEKDGCSMH